MIEVHPDLKRQAYMRLRRRAADLASRLKATEDERDDIHREMMDLRYQLAQAKAA